MKVVAITVSAKDSDDEAETVVVADHFLAAIDHREANGANNTVEVKLKEGSASFTIAGTLLSVKERDLNEAAN